MEYINNYFSAIPTPEIKKEFEDKIQSDPLFAEDVAFYLSAHKAIKEDAETIKQRFKDIYIQYRLAHPITTQKPLIRKLWPYLAAAAVIIGLIFGLNTFLKSGTPQQLADTYVKEHFQNLGVTMSAEKDSLQRGISLINDNKLNEALSQFESILNRDTSSSDAKKYAGIVCMQLKQYDKAIGYFTQLENYSLYSNPGKFYHSIALIKRDQPGDKQEAKNLLQQVVQFDLDEKETAKQLLSKW